MNGSHGSRLTVERPAEMHQTAIVECCAIFGAGGKDVNKLGCEHRRRDFGVLDRKGSAKAAAAIEIFERNELKTADLAEQAKGSIADVQSSQAVATRVIGYAMRKEGAYVFERPCNRTGIR